MSADCGDALGDRPSRRDLIRLGLLGAAGAGLAGTGPVEGGPWPRVRRVSRRQLPGKICPLYLVGMMGPYFYYMGTTCPFDPMNLKVTAITSLTQLTVGCSGSCTIFGGSGARGAGRPEDDGGRAEAPDQAAPDHLFHGKAAGVPTAGLDRPLDADDSFHARPGTTVEVEDFRVEGRKKAVRLCVVTVKTFEVEGKQVPGGHSVAFGQETEADAEDRHPKAELHKRVADKYLVLHRKGEDRDIFYHVILFEK